MSALKKRRKEELVQELENERELVQRCQAGELAAYEVIYRHFEQPLLSFGLRMLGRQEDAEDALQTTFLKLYRGVAKFNFNSKFSTYLFRIMMNVCFDALNKKKKMQTAELKEVEQEYIDAISELDRLAQSQLSQLDFEFMQLYQDRLETIDSQIERCKEALENNPANAHIRRYLLAALQDKKETLKEILEIES